MKTNLPLAGGLIGIEREALRSNADATLATTRHPESLGNVYTHPNITIDYGEALIELVTDPHHSPQDAYQQLLNLHRYSTQNIGEELLWATSMPCRLPENPEHIEIGYFGTSNAGKLKRLYRSGLSYRYGRPMQMIAGVHFNYSPPEALWQSLAAQSGETPTQAWKNTRYMQMLRNLQRYSWLICHLFGASPAVDKSFQPAHGILEKFSDNTLGWKNATTLRMSQLGYQNKVDFAVSFNQLERYIRDLTSAVLTPAPLYEYFGLQDATGVYRQISTNILQISNEYYSPARPKQPLIKGELPLTALKNRGIGYIELRLLDNNPFDPCGISLAQLHFLETFMLWCLLEPVHLFETSDYNELNHNRLRTACCGLSPHFELFNQGKKILSRAWANETLEKLLPIAAQLDHETNTTAYTIAIEQQIQGNQGNAPRLPEQVQHALTHTDFITWGQSQQQVHQPIYQQPLSPEMLVIFNQQRDKSLQAFAEIEAQAENQIPFEEYLTHYFNAIV